MSVIINEFEIVPEQQGQETAVSPQPSAPSSPPPPVSPIDIVDVLRRQTDRLNRIRAH
jgi:hypothetical protein